MDLSQKLKKIGFVKDASNVEECGQHLVFNKQKHVLTSDQRSTLKHAHFCKFRFCPVCNMRKIRFKLAPELFAINEFLSYYDKTKYAYLFLTLTVPNPKVDDLKSTIRHMNKSFQRMAESKAYKQAVKGHFRALEILGSNTPSGEAHPHFHVLLMVRKSYFTNPKHYLSRDKWLSMWQHATRDDSITQVDVRKIRPKTLKDGTYRTAFASAVYEVAKYSTKHTDLTKLNDDDFYSIISQTKNVRFYAYGGKFKTALSALENDPQTKINILKKDLHWLDDLYSSYTFSVSQYSLDHEKKITHVSSLQTKLCSSNQKYITQTDLDDLQPKETAGVDIIDLPYPNNRQ